MKRAYSVLEIKSIDEDERIIEGIATTPQPDRLGDIVESEGAVFELPIPFLRQHRTAEPIGHVTRAKVGPEGIAIRAQIFKSDEPGNVKTRLDDAWQEIKLGLVRGLSIGFNPIETADIKGSMWAQRFMKWEWLELSAVTIPANVDATMQNVKAYDTAAIGDRSNSPGDSGTRVVKAITPNRNGKMKITDQIKQFEATRAAKEARRTELMSAAAEDGSTLEAAAAEEYDTLTADIVEVDKHLVRLRDHEQQNKALALAVDGKGSESASSTRGPVAAVSVKPRVEKGIGFARYAIALINCKGNKFEAAEFARQRWPDHPEVVEQIKAAVAAGTTTDATWAGPLAAPSVLASEFIDLLRPATLIGRIPGLRRVPFNVTVPATTGGGSVAWVGQGSAKPVTALAFASVLIEFAKAAGIVVLTKELVKFSSPSAEQVVRDTMVETMRVFLDTQFIDPAVAAVANVNPASITNGVTGTAASGATAANAAADINALLGRLAAFGYPLSDLVLIMSEGSAFALGGAMNTVGTAAVFPDLGISGGSIRGVPVVASNVVGNQIVGASASSILYADDGQTEIDVSEEASVMMDSAPTNPTVAADVLVSLWQRNLVGLRFDRYANWKKARANAVDRITGVAYVG